MLNFRRVLLILLLIPISLYSAVNSEVNSNKNSDSSNNFPMTVIDSKAREVVIKQKPKRVISVAPSITETIYSLGAGDLLIGRTDYCDYPIEVIAKPSIGTLFEPSIEQIVQLNPDVLIAGTHFQKEVVDKLEEANVTVVIIHEEESIEGVYKGIIKIGEIIDRKVEAINTIENMKSRISKIKNMIPDEKPSVYYVVGFGEYGDYTAGGDTFISELIELAGGINIAKDSVGWTYSLEKIIENNPDIVVCSKYNNTSQQLKSATGYKDLPAVIENRLYSINNNLLDRAGPRVAEGVEQLYEIFYK